MILRRAGRNLATGYLNMAVTSLITLALTPLMVRALGDSLFGFWSVLSSVIGYLAILDLGLGTAATKATAETISRSDDAGRGRLLSQIFFLYLGISLLVLGVASAISILLPRSFGLPGGSLPPAALATFLMGLNLALTLVSRFFAGIAFGHQRQDVPNLIAVGTALLQGMLTWAFLSLGLGIAGLAASLALASLAGLALRAAHCIRAFSPLGISWANRKGADWRALAGFSGGVFLMSVGAQLVFNTDNLVIGSVLGLDQVTGYALAFQLVLLGGLLAQRISDVLFPVLVSSHARRDRDNLDFYFRETTLLGILAFSAFSVPLAAFGDRLMEAWVGPGKFPGFPVLWTILLLFLFQTFLHGQALVLMAAGRMRGMVRLNLTEAGLNLALSLLLVRPLGVWGVALGSLAAHFLVNVVFLPRLTAGALGSRPGLIFRQTLLPALPALLLVFPAAWLLRPHLPPGVPATLLASAAAALLTLLAAWAFLGREKRAWYAGKASLLMGRAS